MWVIRAENVADAWAQAAKRVQRWVDAGGTGLHYEGDPQEPEQTRNGPAWVSPVPVTTVYERPTERVLLDQHRDANPFLHLMESLWMLAGRDDAKFLDQFVGDFSSRYAEPDGRLHGAYGKRWRGWFGHPAHTGAEDSVAPAMLDQLDEVVRLLRKDPGDRQAVIQMWDPEADLGVPGLKDRPCNQQVLLRVRDAADPEFLTYSTMAASGKHEERRRTNPVQLVLDMMVTCRSNDAVWGCYGANAVHFSVLQEYLAARIGVGVGRYYQVSNNWHVYEETRARMDPRWAEYNAHRPYPGTQPLVGDPDTFDEDLRDFLDKPQEHWGRSKNPFLTETAHYVWVANDYRTRGWMHAQNAMTAARQIAAPDWRAACVEWLQRWEARKK